MPKMLHVNITGLSQGAVERLTEIIEAGLKVRGMEQTAKRIDADKKLTDHFIKQLRNAVED